MLILLHDTFPILKSPHPFKYYLYDQTMLTGISQNKQHMLLQTKVDVHLTTLPNLYTQMERNMLKVYQIQPLVFSLVLLLP